MMDKKEESWAIQEAGRQESKLKETRKPEGELRKTDSPAIVVKWTFEQFNDDSGAVYERVTITRPEYNSDELGATVLIGEKWFIVTEEEEEGQ